jgi:hypothetical protein
MANKQPNRRRLSKALVPLPGRAPTIKNKRTNRKVGTSARKAYPPVPLKNVGSSRSRQDEYSPMQGSKAYPKSLHVSPYIREMILLSVKCNYFEQVQRPTLLMNAFARSGWTVNWPEPGVPLGEIGMEKEENVEFWTRAEAQKQVYGRPGLAKWVIHPDFSIPNPNFHKSGLWIFDLCDDFKPHEHKIVERAKEADLVFCSSEALYEKLEKMTDNRYLLRNGVDYAMFEAEEGDTL